MIIEPGLLSEGQLNSKWINHGCGGWDHVEILKCFTINIPSKGAYRCLVNDAKNTMFQYCMIVGCLPYDWDNADANDHLEPGHHELPSDIVTVVRYIGYRPKALYKIAKAYRHVIITCSITLLEGTPFSNWHPGLQRSKSEMSCHNKSTLPQTLRFDSYFALPPMHIAATPPNAAPIANL
jgi:hypothetical protein